MFAAVGERAVEIAKRIRSGQNWIIHQQSRGVLRDDEITFRRNCGAGGDGVLDSIRETPPAHVDGRRCAIVQFDILVVAVTTDRVIHDLVDDHVRDTQTPVLRSGRFRLEPVKARRAVGRTAHRNAVLLRAEPNGVDHPCAVRVFEINRFTRRAQSKTQLRLIEVNESLRLNDRVGWQDKPVRRRVIGEDAIGQVNRRRAVVEQLDEIDIRRIGVGEKFVDNNRAIRVQAGRVRCARRPAHDVARRPCCRIPFAQ